MPFAGGIWVQDTVAQFMKCHDIELIVVPEASFHIHPVYNTVIYLQ